MSRARRLGPALLAGGAAAVVVLSVPGRAGVVAASAAILSAGGVAAAAAARAVRQALPADPSAFDEPPRRRRRRGAEQWRLPELLRVERLLASAEATSLDLHHRLRPRLRELAAVRLADARGVDLDRDPAGARAVLGERAWELLRPDRPEPSDRTARGASADELAAIVEALERL